MWLLRTDYPQEGEFVIATVTQVHSHTVFVTLDEFVKRSGIINIAEIAPGRIRNIRDYVVEGKKIVCKVLTVNKERDHIELSLRRVTEMQKRERLEEMKLEQKAGKIIEFVATKLNIDFKNLIQEIIKKIPKDYTTLNEFLENVASGQEDISILGLEKKVESELLETIKQRIKPSEVEVKGELRLSSPEPDGIDIVKQALKKAEDCGKDSVDITYLGAGRYRIKVKSQEYKQAETILKKCVDAALKSISKKGVGRFIKE